MGTPFSFVIPMWMGSRAIFNLQPPAVMSSAGVVCSLTGDPQDSRTSDPFDGITVALPLFTGRMLSRKVCGLMVVRCTSIGEVTPVSPHARPACAGTIPAAVAAAKPFRTSRRFHLELIVAHDFQI